MNNRIAPELWRGGFPLRMKRTHPDARHPFYASKGAACFDLCAVGLGHHQVTLQPGQAHTFRTGWAFEVPEGWAMMIYSRSGHGFKNDARLANCVGVIDSDYRGEVQVRLTADAHGNGIGVGDGERIAQAMLVQVRQFSLVEHHGELTTTERGAGGFGSTGR